MGSRREALGRAEPAAVLRSALSGGVFPTGNGPVNQIRRAAGGAWARGPVGDLSAGSVVNLSYRQTPSLGSLGLRSELRCSAVDRHRTSALAGEGTASLVRELRHDPHYPTTNTRRLR
jgi:hypothetical protein